MIQHTVKTGFALLRRVLVRPLQNLTIRQKLISIIMFTCVIALGVAGLTFVSYQHLHTRRQMVKRYRTQAGMIGETSAAALTFGVVSDAEENLKAFRVEPSVVLACIYDQQARAFAEYRRAGAPMDGPPFADRQPGESAFTDEYLTVSTPIMLEGEVIGSVSVWSDLDPLRTMFRLHVLIFFGVFSAALMVAYLVSSGVQRVISQPILDLAGIAKTVSEERAYATRAHKTSSDEVGVLIDSFNGMLEQIQARDAALVQANEQLEGRVEARTAELMTANEQLTREMTQRKESERRYRTLLKNIPHRVFYKDICSQYLLCNESYARDLHIQPDAIKGHTDYDFHPAHLAEKYIADDNRIMETGLLEEIEDAYMLDGQALTIRVVKSPVFDKEGHVIGIFGIFWDITARKQAEQALDALNEDLEDTVEELRRSNRELHEFAYVTAHDLKAPLRAIGTLADWVHEDYGDKLESKGREHMQLIKGRVSRMNELIDCILRYSEIGRVARQLEPVELDALVAETIEVMDPPENIEIVIDGPLPVLDCQRIRLLQVFQNLIDNAIKFMDKEQGRVEIGCHDKAEQWEFYVKDNGPGIEKKYHERVFRMFQTLMPRDELESSGIGLAVVKKIVELYGGQVWIESESGQGSTFRFTLPKCLGQIDRCRGVQTKQESNRQHK